MDGPTFLGVFSCMDTLFLMAATGLVLVALLYFCVGEGKLFLMAAAGLVLVASLYFCVGDVRSN
jgi:hypothetical protein